MGKRVAVGLVLLLGLAASGPSGAQPREDIEALQKKIDALEQAQQRLQREVQELRGQVRGRPAAPPAVEAPADLRIAVAGRPTKGRPDARLVLVEFTDYQ